MNLTEKTDLKTDEQVGSETKHIGTDPVTGLEMYRRFKGLNSDLHDKQHRITYEEWLIAKDGKIYEEFYRVKTYLVVDITDEPQYLAYTQWYNQLGPVLLPAINNTLVAMPKDAVNNYVVTQ